MVHILHQIAIEANTKDAIKAVSSLEELSQWLSACDGNYKLREKFTMLFGNKELEMKVMSIDKDRVEWRCTAGNHQWKKTRLIFKFKKDGDRLLLNFSHRDWKETSPLFRHTNTQWAFLLLSLKSYLEEGKGQPQPKHLRAK